MDQLGGVLDDLHGAPAEDVTWPDHGGIPNILGYLQGLFHGGHGRARRLGDTQPGEEILELMPVRRHVDGLGAGAKYGQAGHGQRLGEVDGRLAAELDHRRRRHVVDLFVLQDVPHRFLVQRLEVQPVAGVEVRGHGLWVGIDHDAADPGLGERPGRVHAAVVEFDTLADADGAAADDDGLLTLKRQGLILLVVGAVIIRGGSLEFGGAGVHGLVDGPQAPLVALVAHLLRQHVRQRAHLAVGKAHPFCRFQQPGRELFPQQPALHLNDALQGVYEPGVDVGVLDQGIDRRALPQGRHQCPKPFVIRSQGQLI